MKMAYIQSGGRMRNNTMEEGSVCKEQWNGLVREQTETYDVGNRKLRPGMAIGRTKSEVRPKFGRIGLISFKNQNSTESDRYGF